MRLGQIEKYGCQSLRLLHRSHATFPIPLLPPPPILRLSARVSPHCPSVAEPEPGTNRVRKEPRAELAEEGTGIAGGKVFDERVVGRAEEDANAEAPEHLRDSVIGEVVAMRYEMKDELAAEREYEMNMLHTERRRPRRTRQ